MPHGNLNQKMASAEKFVNSLRVASPCSAEWSAMHGTDTARHCELCNLKVYNLSHMTATEVRTLFNSNDTRMCARFYRRSDGTILTQDCPVGLRAIRRRISKISGAAFAVFLSLGSTIFGQTTSRQTPAEKPGVWRISHSTPRRGVPDNASLVGKIQDAAGGRIPGVEIELRSDTSTITTTSDNFGRFEFRNITAGEYTLVANAGRYSKPESVSVVVQQGERVSVTAVLNSKDWGKTMGMLVEAPRPTSSNSCPVKTTKVD